VSRPVEVSERVGNWYSAFEAVRQELTPSELRSILAAMDEVQGIEQLGSYMQLARQVMANDRAAAIVAGMLVTTGIRPAPMDLSLDDDGA
jgi:hypothetical protein